MTTGKPASTESFDGSAMPRSAALQTSARYGVDAPAFLPIALLLFLISLTAAISSGRPGPFAGSAVLLVCVGFFMHTTRRGKFLVWGELLDSLRLRGDERIL